MTHDGLFRREAVEARSDARPGAISLAQPLRLWVLAGFAVLAASLVVAFLALGQYSRRSRVVGQLVPSLGLTTVVAPTNGVVGRLFPQEGAKVAAGAPLARIDVPRATATGDDTRVVIREALDVRDDSVARLGRSQAHQIEAQLTGTRDRIASARQELRQLEQAIATRRAQVRLGRDAVDRFRRVAADQYVSQLQVDQQEQAALELLNGQQALERQATAIRRDIVQMQQALRELPAQLEASRASTRRELALLDQERVQQEASGELLVQAPVAGLVASRMIEPGQAVQAGQPLLSVLPEGSDLQAQLLVPSRAIAFIEPGDRVMLRYQAYPYQKFGHQGGTVARVSRSLVNPNPSGAGTATNGQEPYYRILVDLDSQTVTAYGQAEPLRPGMVLEADILGETRRLFEWLLEPLYSVRGALAGGSEAANRAKPAARRATPGPVPGG